MSSLQVDPSDRMLLVGSSDGLVAVWRLHVSSHTGEGGAHEELRTCGPVLQMRAAPTHLLCLPPTTKPRHEVNPNPKD